MPPLLIPDVPIKSSITSNRIITLQRLSGSPIMKSYEQLIRTCSAIIPTKNFTFKKEKKRIITLKKNIKNITDDPEENAEFCMEDAKKINRKYARIYLNEVLKDMREIKYVPAFKKS
ncbi:hypothetical protein SteCoe_5456 [Stentor coeruleus]|uniref:Uncharacterized protein n=1 Tax=Stentor coeruleus TaxID=5963 RepID=A0A1R2CSB6_9CILI|nr:hypothetical protein SteCoe_5456 [Stentor coeruleus]